MLIDTERLIHSLKTAIACIIAYLVSKITGIPGSQWIVITVLVVMCAQIFVGSVRQKAYLRFLGTLIGCLMAAIMLGTFGASTLTIIGTLTLASFIFSYIATSQESLMYAGTLGAVTTAIILLAPEPTIGFAIERFVEISLGILIAALTSQYLLPIHASTHLRRAQAATLKQLHDFYTATMITHTVNTETDYQDLDEAIVKSILRQRQLAKESRRETAFNPDQFALILYYEREILRIISFMHQAISHLSLADTELTDFNQRIATALSTLSQVIAKNNAMAAPEGILLPPLSSIQLSSSPSTTMYVDGFLFSAELLLNTISKLANLYNIPIR